MSCVESKSFNFISLHNLSGCIEGIKLCTFAKENLKSEEESHTELLQKIKGQLHSLEINKTSLLQAQTRGRTEIFGRFDLDRA
jgi:hypothetical protein